MSEFPRPRRHDGGQQPNRNRPRLDFITLSPGITSIFMVWREGARQPQAYARTEQEAVEIASARCQPGQRLAIFCCEVIGDVELPRQSPTFTRNTGT